MMLSRDAFTTVHFPKVTAYTTQCGGLGHTALDGTRSLLTRRQSHFTRLQPRLTL